MTNQKITIHNCQSYDGSKNIAKEEGNYIWGEEEGEFQAEEVAGAKAQN